jgi:hypothetical protein
MAEKLNYGDLRVLVVTNNKKCVEEKNHKQERIQV